MFASLKNTIFSNTLERAWLIDMPLTSDAIKDLDILAVLPFNKVKDVDILTMFPFN